MQQIDDILEDILVDVMEEAVEPWSEYITVTNMKSENVTDQFFSPTTILKDLQNASSPKLTKTPTPRHLEAGGDWDSMEITSHPAEVQQNVSSSVNLNYYYTC